MNTADKGALSGGWMWEKALFGAPGPHGKRVRSMVLDVIVSEALKKRDWRNTCAESMKSNQITPEEVEEVVSQRQAVWQSMNS